MNKKIENFIGGKFQNSENDTIPEVGMPSSNGKVKPEPEI